MQTWICPPASPVYVLKGPQHHSLPCVHPASRPNECSVYLPLAAGKRGGVVAVQLCVVKMKLSLGKHGEDRCVQLQPRAKPQCVTVI